MNLSRFHGLANAGVQALRPYQPGKPVEELERELGLKEAIKLASNENPLGPSPQAVRAIRDAALNLERYPDGNGFRLKRSLALQLAVEPNMITLGNGSNDVLELVARAFLGPDSEAIYSEHAFAVYALATQACSARSVVTPAKDWGHDLNAMLGAVTSKTRVVFIANPNNPTGTWLPRSAVVEFMEQLPPEVICVLDEAYFEYVQMPEYPDGMRLLRRFDNLVVTRTFSKIYGLAGLRIGYGVSSKEITDLLNRVRQPFNVNSVALQAAEAALKDQSHVQASIDANDSGMRRLEGEFGRLGLDWIPSVGNFICFAPRKDAEVVYQQLLERGVIVRPIAAYGMPGHLRATVGTTAENERLIEALEAVLR